MAWLNREKAPLQKGHKKDTPDGLWERCSECNAINLRKDFEANQNVCPKCDHHFPLPARERISNFLDPDSFEEFDADLRSPDPLGFVDSKPYKDRLDAMIANLKQNDAIFCGRGLLVGQPVQIGVFDFKFMGGSMGSVVGEKIARLYLRAAKNKEPAIIFTSSGGARMQEGILSLMQMAKTSVKLAQLAEAGLPYISLCTDPTTGGTTASYAMLGDINIAEPGALIGFAGPRIVKDTTGKDLPDGFQSSEFLLEHGFLDFITHRKELKKKVNLYIDLIQNIPVREEAVKSA